MTFIVVLWHQGWMLFARRGLIRAMSTASMQRHATGRQMAAQWHAAARRRSIGLIHPTGICLPLIDKLAHDVVVSRRVIAALAR
jgi:hypothetical protein